MLPHIPKRRAAYHSSDAKTDARLEPIQRCEAAKIAASRRHPNRQCRQIRQQPLALDHLAHDDTIGIKSRSGARRDGEFKLTATAFHGHEASTVVSEKIAISIDKSIGLADALAAHVASRSIERCVARLAACQFASNNIATLSIYSRDDAATIR